MNLAHVRGILTCLLLTLATGAFAQVERFVEGVHYTRLPELSAAHAPDASAGQRSVLEIFWYGCGHCYAFDPLLNAWVGKQDDTIEFARTPMIWDATTKQHAQLFYTARALGLQEQLHDRIFNEIHQKRNYLLDDAAIGSLLAEFGVDQATVTKTQASFGVDADLRRTEAQLREWVVPSVPALIINGTWMINNTEQVPTHREMLEVAEFLLNKKTS
jgi:thiol:disulfide interchange protein DsbA